jgi:hypothetical protein
VRLCLNGTAAANWTSVHFPDEKLDTEPLCPSQILHGLTRAQTWATGEKPAIPKDMAEFKMTFVKWYMVVVIGLNWLKAGFNNGILWAQ